MSGTTVDKQKWVFKNNETFEFTLSPRDEFQYNRSDNRFKSFRKKMYNLFTESLDDYGKYRLYIEVSSPQYANNGEFPRLHLHGTIILKDYIGFLINGFHKISSVGRVQFNKYRKDVWPDYMTKDQKSMNASKSLRGVSTIITNVYDMDKVSHKKTKRSKMYKKPSLIGYLVDRPDTPCKEV